MLRKVLFLSSMAVLAFLAVAGGVSASKTEHAQTADVMEYYTQWEQSGHVSTMLLYDGRIKLPDDAMCLICHDSNGFLQWADAGFDPDWGDDAKLAKTGPAPAANCVTCHDPAATDPDMLRLLDQPVPLRAGFTVSDAGSGTACVVCHNTRRGQRNDVSRPVTDKRGPHESANADMIYGQNFFFVPHGETTPHAGLPDSCVSCHMNPEYGGGEHTFTASWDGCAACHDDTYGQPHKEQVIAARNQLKAALEKAFTQAAQAASDTAGFSFKYVAKDESVADEFTMVKKGAITDVNAAYFHGNQAYIFQADGQRYMATIDVIRFGDLEFLTSKQGQVMAKAGWNLYMIDHDRSDGAHNAPYVLAAVNATIGQLEQLDFSSMTPLQE